MIYLTILILLVYIGYYNQSVYLNYTLAFCILLGLLSIIYTIIISFFIDIAISTDNEICFRNDKKRISLINKLELCPSIVVQIIIYNKHLNKIIEKKKIKLNDKKLLYELSSLECGDIEVTIDKIIIKGIFGLLRVHKKINNKLIYRVYPKATFYTEEDIKKTMIIGEGEPINKTGSDYQEIYEIRPFQTGDDLRYIHPALSNKFNNYMVKVGSETRRSIATYKLVKENSFIEIVRKLEVINAIYRDLSNKNEYIFFVQYEQDYYNISDIKALISLFDLVYQEYIK